MQISENTSVKAVQSVVTSDATQDFETFLRMLTTQIQNQDPLSPLDSDDFANQLATFSLVEQQTLTNQNLENLVAEQRSKTFLEHVSLLGRSVSHSGSFRYTGERIEFDIGRKPVGSDEVVVIVNKDGAVVAQPEVVSGATSIEWNGVDDQGQPVAPGEYSARWKNMIDGALTNVPVLVRSTVQEVFYQDDLVILKLADDTEITEGQLVKIGI